MENAILGALFNDFVPKLMVETHILRKFLQKERFSQILLLPLLCLSGLIHILICNTKIGEKSDMAKF